MILSDFHSASLRALTNRRDDIVVADMEVDMVIEKVADLVANKKEEEKMADMELDMVAWPTWW